MDGIRPATLLEELDIEGIIVEHRRGELYRLAAKRIRELEAARPEEAAIEQCAKVCDVIAKAEYGGRDWMKWDDHTAAELAKRIRALLPQPLPEERP